MVSPITTPPPSADFAGRLRRRPNGSTCHRRRVCGGYGSGRWFRRSRGLIVDEKRRKPKFERRPERNRLTAGWRPVHAEKSRERRGLKAGWKPALLIGQSCGEVGDHGDGLADPL